MPGPPPAGVSSTVRCLPSPCSRMSRTSRFQRFFSSALPKSETPSGPGNISGNRVKTVADQLLDMIGAVIVLGHGNDKKTSGDIDHRHCLPGEGQMHAVDIGARQFDHVAGAEIVQGQDLAQHPPLTVARFQPDQVGMVEFVRLRRRQGFAAHEQFGALQRLGRIAVPYLPKRHHRLARLGGAKGGDGEDTAVLGMQRAIARQGIGRGSEELDLHLALETLRADDGGHENLARQCYSAAGASALSAALALAAARSCAFFLGWAFCGLLWMRAFTKPALARNLCTRSDATAPLPIQAWADSRFSLRRSA